MSYPNVGRGKNQKKVLAALRERPLSREELSDRFGRGSALDMVLFSLRKHKLVTVEGHREHAIYRLAGHTYPEPKPAPAPPPGASTPIGVDPAPPAPEGRTIMQALETLAAEISRMVLATVVPEISRMVLEKVRTAAVVPVITGEVPDSDTAPTPVVAPATPAKPRVTVAGLLPSQAGLLSSEYGRKLDLSFVVAGEHGSRARSAYANGRRVLLMTGKIGHNDVELVRAAGGVPEWVNGGMTSIRDKLDRIVREGHKPPTHQ